MFNFPVELHAEIFKYLPNQKRISKELNRYNQVFFYNQYHDLEITKHEFLGYIQTMPQHFILFYEKNNTTCVRKMDEYIIYIFDYINGYYQLSILNIVMDINDDCDKYNLSLIDDEIRAIDVSYIEKLYLELDPIYIGFDLVTLSNILTKRNINLNADYTKQYILNHINDNTYIINHDIVNMFSYFEMIKTVFYIDFNISMFDNPEIDKQKNLNMIMRENKDLFSITFTDVVDFYDQRDIEKVDIIRRQYELYKGYLITLL